MAGAWNLQAGRRTSQEPAMISSVSTTSALPAAGFGFGKPEAPSAARHAFDEYARKTPAEKMRDAILGTMGLTEEQLKAMNPKEREAIEAKVRELMKQKIQEALEKKDKTGVLVDVKA
jgi:hypothetical protein